MGRVEPHWKCEDAWDLQDWRHIKQYVSTYSILFFKRMIDQLHKVQRHRCYVSSKLREVVVYHEYITAKSAVMVCARKAKHRVPRSRLFAFRGPHANINNAKQVVSLIFCRIFVWCAFANILCIDFVCNLQAQIIKFAVGLQTRLLGCYWPIRMKDWN